MTLIGLFCCNPDPDAVPDTDFDQDEPRYTELVVMYNYWPLFAVKWHYLGQFDVIWNQIWIFDPDADFDQDGPRYTELTVMYNYLTLFLVKCHYLGYFDVIWIDF